MRKTFLILIFILLSACSNENTPNLILEREKVNFELAYNNTEADKIKYLSDGLKVTGYIVKPKEIDGKAPVLYFNRGGNRDYFKINNQTLNYLSFWADQGFVVLASQYRGVDGGEGQEEFGGADIHDVLNLGKVAKELPYADMDKQVMLGMSRGGMMTFLAIKSGMELDAAAVIGGVTDLEQWYTERGDPLQSELDELIGSPEINKEEYINRSAVYWADEIDVPLLVLHGENDQSVPVSQAEVLVDKLNELGKEYQYIKYPNADHALSDYFQEYTEEIMNWYDSKIQQ